MGSAAANSSFVTSEQGGSQDAVTGIEEAPYEFFIDFTAGKSRPFVNGKESPAIGVGQMGLGGAGFASAMIGGPAGFRIDAPGAGTIYASAGFSDIPHELGGDFVWTVADFTGGGVPMPTIACLLSQPALAPMVHLNVTVNSGGVLDFTPGYWNAGGTINGAFAFRKQSASPTMVPFRNYRRRAWFNTPWVNEVISEVDTGVVVVNQAIFDPTNIIANIGPGAFWELTGALGLRWLNAYARLRPLSKRSAAFGSFPGGIEATPIGGNMPSTIRATQIHLGSGLPTGLFSIRAAGDTDLPKISSLNTALLYLTAEANGFGAGLELKNNWNIPSRLFFGYDLNFDFSVNSAVYMRKIYNGDFAFQVPIRLGSDTGPRLSAGTGSPEGVVTAPVSSRYSRTDGGAGTCLYVKESGTGNTGWVAK